jgi:endoglucanase Acf2
MPIDCKRIQLKLLNFKRENSSNTATHSSVKQPGTMNMNIKTAIFGLTISIFSGTCLHAAIVPVGSGSYTTTFPGVDTAGRNGYPGGSPQLSGNAIGKPVPSNDWWSKLLNSDHADNLFNYPLAMGTLSYGLDIGRVWRAPRDPFDAVVVGVSGLNATRVTVDDYSDWTVTMRWAGTNSFRATSGIGMPFVYFSKATTDTASVTVSKGTATINGEILLITNSEDGANFAVYAPNGSTWTQSDSSTYTYDRLGGNYWSLAILPAGDPSTVAAAWQQYAYVEPVNTEVNWSYDETNAVLRTEFITTVTVHEGSDTNVIQGLLPHQWAHIAPDAPILTGETFASVRGELKMLASNTFATERTFHGILPTLPAVGPYSPGFDPAQLHDKITLMENDTLATWTDSYNEGQVMNRLIQTARAAHETGDFEARDKMIATVKERLEDWLTYQSGEVAFLFYYNTTWTSLLGYPGGHGQDTNLNDHHFHWGYFIHAAAFMEQFEPGWASQWGDMVNLLVRDAASPDRSDPLFPFLRNFSPFAGHSWANGFATFPFGNDQESTSESMQFCSSLIHWGAVTGDDAIRDLGIYLYTTEQSAVEEYWFDMYNRNFDPGHPYSLVSRVWGNDYDNGTFWTADIAASYGIELYPIHGGSLYLGHNINYASNLWAEMTANTGILINEENPNLWHDTYWKFQAFTDPAGAIALYNSNPDRNLKFGISDAQTYYWLHAMNGLGQVDATVTADDPLAAVFNKQGTRTYVAHNYSGASRTVNFSDGASLVVPANSLATSLDLPFDGAISTPFPTAPTGGTVPLTVTLSGDVSGVTAVEFFDGLTSLGTVSNAPYFVQTAPLNVGRHTFYARVYAGSDFEITGLTQVIVGDTVPYSGSPTPLPGTFDAGDYDTYVGGIGQGITYHDSSVGNAGDYRTAEYVDASSAGSEGAILSYIADGEWLDYTVDVASDGIYSLSLRYACGNTAGGGPFFLELDGQRVSANKSVAYTGDWDAFGTATLNGIELTAGEHVLRLNFIGGELNVGRLTFTRTGDLGYVPPVADAGTNVVVVAPDTSAFLDGSGSTTPPGETLTYLWEQTAGPAVAVISDSTAAVTGISGISVDGSYRFRLTVDDGTHTDFDEMEVVRGATAQLPPLVAILSPTDGASGYVGQLVTVTVSASDSDGSVTQVELFDGAALVGTDTSAPYSFNWTPTLGAHTLTARATDSDGLQATSPPVTFTADPKAYNGTPAAIPGKVEAENFDFGGEGAAYHDTTANNEGGAYRPTEGVDIEGCTDVGGGFNVGWTQPTERMEYTVNVATAGDYTLTSRVAGGGGTGAFRIEVDGDNKSGTISVPNTGGWQEWRDIETPVTLAEGEQVIRVVIEAGDVNINYYEFTLGGTTNPPPPPPPTNSVPFNGTPASIPGTIEVEDFDNGGEGVAYHDADPANVGGIYRTTEGVDIGASNDGDAGYSVGWTASGEWMNYSVDVATAGEYAVTARVARGLAGSGSFHIEANGVDVTGTITVNDTGGWAEWEDVVASATLGSGEQVLTLVIDGPDVNLNRVEFALVTPANSSPVFTSNPVVKANATEGTAYTGQTLAGDVTDADSDPLSFSLVPGGPTWLNVATNGALSGTPGIGYAGLNSWTVQVSDGVNSPVTATLQITVDSAPVPPVLSIQSSGTNLEVLWPVSSSGFSLYSCTNLIPPVTWSAVPNTPVVHGEDWMVTMPMGESPQYFRLEAE